MSLISMLNDGVVDITFSRTIPVKGKSPTRRMYASQCSQILSSNNGRITLNYRPPTKTAPYNAQSKGLVVVWDILMQDYRTINPNNVTINTYIDADDFWEYFNANIFNMTGDEKIAFMNA